MATGTGIYVPTEQLGDGTADDTKFLRGDSTWADASAQVSPEEYLDLLIYAFRRISFLEAALGMNEVPESMAKPEAYALLEEDVWRWK